MKTLYGINPFSNPDPEGAAMAISAMLNSIIKIATGDTMLKDNFDATRAVENIAILLSITYSKKYGSMLPSLEDIYKLLSNFDLIQVMVEELKEDESLAKEHEVRIKYFEKFFYKNAPRRNDMEKYVELPIALLENFLTNKAMKTVFCNRYNNIDFTESMQNGDVIFLCTRRARISGTAYDMYELYVSLILRFVKGGIVKKTDVKGEPIPYFMYFDDFGPFISDSNAELLSTATKGRVGMTITVHNLEQLKKAANYYTFLNGTKNRIIMAGLSFPECKFWAIDDFPVERVWADVGHSTDDSSIESIMNEKDMSKAHLKWEQVVNPGEMFVLKFKSCAYRVKNNSGRYTAGLGKLDFIDKKHFEPVQEKQYNFNTYLNKKEKSSSKFANPFAKNKSKTSVDENLDSFADDDTDIFNNDETSIDPIKYNTSIGRRKKK